MRPDDEDDVLEEESTAVVDSALLRASEGPGERNRHILIRADRSQLGRVLGLTEQACTLGRHPDCDVWLDHEGVSRKHLRLLFRDEGYDLEDLGSANGTFVNGERVGVCRLNDGDLIQVGPMVLLRYAITDSEHEQTLRELYEASVRDALTGAYNREHLTERLRAELSFAARHRTDVCVLMMDLDHFKRVNDTHGHPAGDAVLIAVAKAVRDHLRAEDVFARYGGEEFAVVLRGVALDGARGTAERLRKMIESLSVQFEGKTLGVTVSVGCASIACAAAPTNEGLVAAADRRLYIAKRSGRNRVVAEG